MSQFILRESPAGLSVGDQMHELATRLFPINRSITGNGVRQTLKMMQEIIPIEIHEIASGTSVFDWTIPREWNIREAYIIDPDGNKIADFSESNLHILNYSVPYQGKMGLEELKKYIHTLPDKPEWIPYRTSYYQENWGFCMAHNQYVSLPEGEYEVYIDTTLEDGYLTYGEFFLPGESEEEILISAHTCHPSMANDNLSGLVVALYLADSMRQQTRKYSYRFVFAPTTIGTIAWLAVNQEQTHRIKAVLAASFLGDPAPFTYKRSKKGTAEIDIAVELALKESGYPYSIIEYTPFGDDGRQYNSLGFNIPAGNLTRSQYDGYPEYHTSADDLNLVKPEFLEESLNVYRNSLSIMEENQVFLNLNPHCEPQLGKRGLYKMIGGDNESQLIQMAMLWVLGYTDGQTSLIRIAERSVLPFRLIKKAADMLLKADLIKVV